jgi:hypothetical protein
MGVPNLCSRKFAPSIERARVSYKAMMRALTAGVVFSENQLFLEKLKTDVKILWYNSDIVPYFLLDRGICTLEKLFSQEVRI